MQYTISEIARALEAEAFGDLDITVTGVSEPAEAGPDDIALALNPDYGARLAEGRARAAVLWGDADWQAMGLKAAILMPRPRLAMAGLNKLFDPGPEIESGIHPMAVVDPTAQIGDGAAIGPFVVIGRDAKIGARARIASHASVGAEAKIGDDAVIHSGVRIGAGVRIGDRFIGLQNCVVGGDGFAFVTPEKSNVEQARETLGSALETVDQRWHRIHSLGTVEIADDVEVGANSTIDRGTVRATTIGRGTKIDNLVHIGHNCTIGEDCLLCGQVGIAGSVKVGNRVVLAGQVGVSDNLFIGDDVVAGGSSIILSNVPAGRMILGYPAIKMDQQIEAAKNIRRLPRLIQTVKDLQKAVPNPDKSD
jgi:UDP-3-O-[3-hydroxymyristoyl] glucosamine N-acyltransferase